MCTFLYCSRKYYSLLSNISLILDWLLTYNNNVVWEIKLIFSYSLVLIFFNYLRFQTKKKKILELLNIWLFNGYHIKHKTAVVGLLIRINISNEIITYLMLAYILILLKNITHFWVAIFWLLFYNKKVVFLINQL